MLTSKVTSSLRCTCIKGLSFTPFFPKSHLPSLKGEKKKDQRNPPGFVKMSFAELWLAPSFSKSGRGRVHCISADLITRQGLCALRWVRTEAPLKNGSHGELQT